jgi:NAD(P)-dependent dehydrogenase (short-subunit alcohol dehydrogenase family)
MQLGLAGRRAIVTGGSKGLGKAIAAELIAEGASVVICSRHVDELDATAAELTKAAPDGAGAVHALPCDVTAADEVARFIDAAATALGGLDVLVNNAGGARPGQFGTLTDDDWHADIEVKLLAQIRCTRAALPLLRQSSAPRVININAVYARYPDPASACRRRCLSSWAGRESWSTASTSASSRRRSGSTSTRCGRPRYRPISSSGGWPRPRFRSAGSGGPTRSPGW